MSDPQRSAALDPDIAAYYDFAPEESRLHRLVEVARRESERSAHPLASCGVGDRALESEPTLLGVSAHLLAVGRRPMHR